MSEKERSSKIFSRMIFIIISLLIFGGVLTITLMNGREKTIQSTESKDIDYKVYLKENEFYKDKYMEQNKEYIASLIDYIDTDFKYRLNISDNNLRYTYSYKVVAEVDVKGASKNTIYNDTETLVKEKELDSDDIDINEKIKIQYNKYNDLINKFVDVFELNNVDSNLILKLYVYVKDHGKVVNNANKEVSSLTIPLTTKTVAINLKSDTKDNNKDYLVVKNDTSYMIGMIVSIVLLLIVVFQVIELIRLVRILNL